MGGGSKTTTVRKRDPEPKELTNLRNQVYNMVSPLAGGPRTYTWENSLFGSAWNNTQNQIEQANDMFNQLGAKAPEMANNVTDQADKISKVGDSILPIASNMSGNNAAMSNLSGKIEGVGDRQGELAKVMQAFAESGELPQSVKDNMNSAINSELSKNTGSALNNLAARGVINGSVANRSIDSLSNAAADAYAKNYLNAYNAVLGGYSQASNTLGAQGDTYAKAISGHQASNQGLNDQIGAYKGAADVMGTALQGYNAALANNSDMMKTAAALPETLSNSLMAQFSPAYSMWKDWQTSYDNREDYDTVVSSGK